ncbi:MAG TPA: hypothetical protein VKA27_04605 [Sunxiuqinia sp.]|nr:hypothetical protein [Sunxiuqinia sp.]
MKKHLFTVLFIILTGTLFAQSTYKYVIIPTKFPELSEGFNPYGMSSSIQAVLIKKNIPSQIEEGQRPADYCDALTVDVIKVSSLLTNKLKVEFKNCRNQVVWQGEGKGQSKDFPTGYAEAFADAVSNFNKLPENPEAATASKSTKKTEVISDQDAADYQPKNPFYNSTYFVDLVDGDGNTKKLVVINGKLLGYKDLQVIGTLTPSGLDNVYTLNWTDKNGDQLTGVANLSDTELKISLPSGGSATVITLKKLKK